MNIVLFTSEDIVADGRVRLSGRRLLHVRDVLGAREGDALSVGLLGGKLGAGKITRLEDENLEMEVLLDRDPPAALPLTIILALPRPKVMRRVLYSLTVLGVKRIYLLHTAQVEKSYWQSPFLEQEAIQRQLLLGLEQARDTVLPEVTLKQRFKPFVEDELPQIAQGTLALAAHPAADMPCPHAVAGPVTLAVGPEGGFIPYEIDMLLARGFHAVTVGGRALNVESAVPSLIGRLLP